jgi:CRISPR-associated protein Csm5
MTNSDRNPVVIYQAYKECNYESKIVKLSSPILHIGSQYGQLNPFEFVQRGSQIYLPNKDLLTKVLHKKGGSFLNDYIDAIDKGESIAPLLQKAFKENWDRVKTDDNLPIFPEKRPLWTKKQKEKQQITNLRPMIRNGMGELYIPGSSIKGAIRTAIAYYLLKHAEEYQVPQETRISHIEQELRQKLNKIEEIDKQRKSKNKSLLSLKAKQDQLSGKKYITRLFSDFKLEPNINNLLDREKLSESNTDFLRAIKISDSKPLKLKTLINKKTGKPKDFNISAVAEVIVSSYDENNKAKYKASIFAEVVYDVITEFTITLDSEMLSWFRHQEGMTIPFNSIAQLLNICQEFAQEQWVQETKYWEKIINNQDRGKDLDLDFDLMRDKYYDKPYSYQLRLGWGSGMTGTTIDWLLQDDLRSKIRDACGIAAPNFEAPKSRRTIVNSEGEICYVPGWVKLTVL